MTNFLLNLLWIPIFSFSQFGILDESFGDGGFVFNDEFPDDLNYVSVNSMIVADDEGIYIIGKYRGEYNDEHESWVNNLFVAKYLSNGVIDQTFGEDGFKRISIENYSFLSSNVLLTNDNLLLVISMYEDLSNLDGYNPDISILKLNLDGNFVTSFADNGILEIDCSYCIGGRIIEDGDNFYVSGQIYTNEFGVRSILKKFSNMGAPIIDFGENGQKVFIEDGHSIEIDQLQSDENNNLYVNILRDSEETRLIKLNQIGEEIGSVLINEESQENLFLSMYDDGNLYFSGNHNWEEFVLKKYNAETLNLDLTFGQEGYVYNDFDYTTQIGSRVLMLNNNIYQIGYVGDFFPSMDLAIAANNKESGELDSTFGEGGKIVTAIEGFDLPLDVKLLGTGRLLILNDNSAMIVCYKIYDGLSVEDISIDSKIQIAPNPTSNSFVISGLNGIQNQVQIFDFSGKLIQKFNSVQNNQTLNLASIPRGNYILKIQSKDKTETKKLIIK